MKSDQIAELALPSEEEMTRAMGGRAPEYWAGNCHGASMVLAKLLGPDVATVRRGYFIGETKPGAYFHGRPSQHSWVELRDGRVADPTRFAFVGGDPWPIWVGPDDDYDVGGCKLAGPSRPAPHITASESEPIELSLGSVEYVAELLGADSVDYSLGDDEDGQFLGMTEPWIMVSVEQIYWLAHLPVKDREGPGVLARWFAAEVYEAIIEAGYSAAIPIDRRDWILPERSEGRSSF